MGDTFTEKSEEVRSNDVLLLRCLGVDVVGRDVESLAPGSCDKTNGFPGFRALLDVVRLVLAPLDLPNLTSAKLA